MLLEGFGVDFLPVFVRDSRTLFRFGGFFRFALRGVRDCDRLFLRFPVGDFRFYVLFEGFLGSRFNERHFPWNKGILGLANPSNP